MPKILAKRKKPLSTAEKVRRRDTWRVVQGFGFIDPYPNVLGTLPEKIVYAYLQKNGIPFYFQTEVNVAPDIPFTYWLRPDFVIPSLKLIIEIQGSYWHSSDEAIDKDADKYAWYTYAGYKVIYLWDYMIDETAVPVLLREYAPEILNYSGPHVGEVITEHKEYIDDTAGAVKRGLSRRDFSNYTAKIKPIRKRTKRGVLSYEPR